MSLRRSRAAVPGIVRRLALMVRAGLDLGTALDALVRGATDQAVRDLVADIRERVSSGASFASALEARSEVFPASLVASVAAAEASGQLGNALEEAARVLEEERRIRRTVRGLLVYPCALLFLSILVVIALMVFVLPRFREIFESAGVPLPFTTTLLLEVSDLLLSYPLQFGVGVAVLLCGIAGLWQIPAVRAAVQEQLLSLPWFGTALLEISFGRLLLSLGTMLQHGVPLLDALRIAGRSSQIPRFADLLIGITESATSGAGVSPPFRSCAFCPPETSEIIATAERSGALAWSLCFVGKMHQEDGEARLRTYVRLLEPVLIIFMGLIVALIVSSVMLPLFDLSRVAGA